MAGRRIEGPLFSRCNVLVGGVGELLLRLLTDLLTEASGLSSLWCSLFLPLALDLVGLLLPLPLDSVEFLLRRLFPRLLDLVELLLRLLFPRLLDLLCFLDFLRGGVGDGTLLGLGDELLRVLLAVADLLLRGDLDLCLEEGI